MSKIGTVHVEVKPVLVSAALDEIAELIEARVREAVQAGISAGMAADQ